MRRAWLVWGLGVLAYAVAVFDRSSLGVAGLQAQHRFGVGATALASFAVLQLAVYASLQVPVGMLLDRYGSRVLLVVGATSMGVGQLVLAAAHGVGPAVVARVLVGAGDACSFLSVLRLVPAWFPARRVPLVTQLTGILGQLGQLLAAYPLLAALRGVGWGWSFTGAAVLGLLVGGLVALALQDSPRGRHRDDAPPTPAEVRRLMSEAWGEPGTRIGLWTHFTTQFSGTVFGLLWGYPFLVAGEGRSPATAAALLSVLVLASIAIGPLLGELAGGWPMRRSALTLSVVGASATVWAVVLLWPGRAPLALLVVLVLVLATNGPGSLVGFDYARTFNPGSRLGSASGIVNVGGFAACIVTVLGIGVILDAVTPPTGRHYPLSSFRWAFALQYVVWAVGLVAVLRNRRLLRRRFAEQGVLIDPLPRAVARRWRASRSD